MKRVLYLTNIPAPYRVHFFDELSQYCDVTVLLVERSEDHTGRDRQWYEAGENRFSNHQLNRRLLGRDLCIDVLDWLKKPFDTVVLCGYTSPTMMLAAAWLRAHGRSYWMEVDGGLIRRDSLPKYLVKRTLVGGADSWISTGNTTTDFLCHYGAKRERVFVSPFSSLNNEDILQTVIPQSEKLALREKLGIRERNVIVSVGQFIPRKGFDILLSGASGLLPDTGIYIIGGEPDETYQNLAKHCGQTAVHFIGFLKKNALLEYYKAADVFVLPTREDIWGLVINEAMACGLPVVTTDKCVAGLELVSDGENGYIVPVENAEALTDALNRVLSGDVRKMGTASLEKIRPYTIEAMAQSHGALFG